MHWRGLHGTWPAQASARRGAYGDGANGVTFDDATRTVYVATYYANTISVIDGARCNADRTRGCDGRWRRCRPVAGRARPRWTRARARCRRRTSTTARSTCTTWRAATGASSAAAVALSRTWTWAACRSGSRSTGRARRVVHRPSTPRTRSRCSTGRRATAPATSRLRGRGRAGDHGRVLVAAVRRPRHRARCMCRVPGSDVDVLAEVARTCNARRGDGLRASQFAMRRAGAGAFTGGVDPVTARSMSATTKTARCR